MTTVAVQAVDSLGIFELDGNAVEDSAAGFPVDWETVYLEYDIGGTCPPTGASVYTGIVNDENPDTGVADQNILFQGGSKDIQDVTEWKYKVGSTPDKDQIINAYAIQYLNPTDESP
ncbi:hypothetical protein [Marinobacterium aestuariivivens]|uniref:Uncharacterized protein n=1 Tax=Marinobacterium aestuariivivens TaxID=1698799 RepID=A0ABW1ZUM5_9GAMM